MFLSSRVKEVNEAITLKLNDKANQLIESGHHVFNLTTGQLPYKPLPDFSEKIANQVNFLKSFQYSPVQGFKELRQKVMNHLGDTRGISFTGGEIEFDCVVSNGGKHSIYNILGALVDPGDEVVIISPYWISYPEMIKFWGGVPIVVKTKSYNTFIPDLEDIRKVVTPRTKMIIINSPNNPSGIHYPDRWMEDFAKLLEEFPDLAILSDEIYYELFYFDPKPTYFYQKNPKLLERTIIVDGISKTFASTGLRIGYCVGPKNVMNAVTRIQAQTTSGPSSLIQRALIDMDDSKVTEFLLPIKNHLRRNSEIVREYFKTEELGNCWYQTVSAFYFTINLTLTPCFARYNTEPGTDYSTKICQDLLDETSVAIIPASDFGIPNAARISLVLEESPFTEAMNRLTTFLARK